MDTFSMQHFASSLYTGSYPWHLLLGLHILGTNIRIYQLSWIQYCNHRSRWTVSHSGSRPAVECYVVYLYSGLASLPNLLSHFIVELFPIHFLHQQFPFLSVLTGILHSPLQMNCVPHSGIPQTRCKLFLVSLIAWCTSLEFVFGFAAESCFAGMHETRWMFFGTTWTVAVVCTCYFVWCFAFSLA